MNMEVYNSNNNVNTVIEYKLTTREVEYLGLVALGFHNYEIAKLLRVTNPAVRKALESVFRKLCAKDRANAVAIAFVHKLLNVDVLTKLVEKYKVRTHFIC